MGNEVLTCSHSKMKELPVFNKIVDSASPTYRPFLELIGNNPVFPDAENSFQFSAGTWCEGDQKSGQGIIYSSKHLYYEGDILQGKAEGEGKMVLQKSNPVQYVGNFQRNQAHGEGEFSSQSRQFCLKGKWKHGKPLQDEPMSFMLYQQKGEITFLSGPEKRVKIEFSNGMSYNGAITIKDVIVLTGNGEMRFPDGSIYMGGFKDGAMHGIGRYTWKNGDSYEGDYLYSKRQGKGVYTLAGGQVISGTWHNGELVQMISPLEDIMQPVLAESVYIWGLFNDLQYPVPTKIKELENKAVISVASGGYFFMAATALGEVYGWGATKYCRFGVSSAESIPIPKLIPLKVRVKRVAAGNWHSMLIDIEGKLHAVGHNKSGACGVGHFNNVDTYEQVKMARPVEQLSLGDCFSMILSSEGELYTCGHGEYHGHKKAEHLTVPKKLELKEPVRAFAAGFVHSLAATDSHTYSWGKNQCFQLGHGDKQDRKEPTVISKLEGIKIIQLSCTRGQKNSHSMAVAQDVTLWTWGSGYKGKLGHQNKWTHEDPADQPLPRRVQHIEGKITKSSAGGIHSNILNDNGQVLSFGCGSDGRLGHIQSKDFKYLYREGYPRVLDTLKPVLVTDLGSSYYHNICIGHPRS